MFSNTQCHKLVLMSVLHVLCSDNIIDTGISTDVHYIICKPYEEKINQEAQLEPLDLSIKKECKFDFKNNKMHHKRRKKFQRTDSFQCNDINIKTQEKLCKSSSESKKNRRCTDSFECNNTNASTEETLYKSNNKDTNKKVTNRCITKRVCYKKQEPKNEKEESIKMLNIDVSHDEICLDSNSKSFNSQKNTLSAFGSVLIDFNIRNGVMSAIKSHHNDIIPMTTGLIDCTKCIYKLNDDFATLDFQRFFDTYKESVDNTRLMQKGKCDYIENNKQHNTLEDLISTLVTVRYSKKELDLNNIIHNLNTDKNIYFISSNIFIGTISSDFSGLNAFNIYKPIDFQIYSDVHNIYIEFKKEATNESDCKAICVNYISCITKMLFCKNTDQNLYVLKPEFWKLQLFMPELYFYVLWKIKEVSNFSLQSVNPKNHLIYEIDLFFTLLTKYIVFINHSIEYSIRAEYLKSDVINLRNHILAYLKILYPNTSCTILYNFGSEAYEQKTHMENKESISMIFNILAFAGQSSEFSIIVCIKMDKNKKIKIDDMQRSKFINTVLMNNMILKRQTIATLQMVVTFLSLMRNKDKFASTPNIMAFQLPSLMMYQRESDPSLYVLSLSNTLLLSYFSEIIYDIIKK